MHPNAWASLLRQLPADHLQRMMLVTASGSEIALQAILRLDHEFVAILGRMSGSQDGGRLFFLPYQNIDYLGFQYAVKEEEFQELFGNLSVPAPPTAAALAALPLETPGEPVVTAEPQQEPAAEPPPTEPVPELAEAAAQPPVGPSNRTPVTIKSAILERFRNRTGSSNAGTNLRPPVDG